MSTTRRRRRRLAPLPEDMDPTDEAVVPYLLDHWVEQTADLSEWDLATETSRFLALVAADYPAALKAFADRELQEHMAMLLRSRVIAIRATSRRKLHLERVREKARQRAEDAGEVYDDSEDEEIPSVFRTSAAVRNDGRYRQVAAMTRIDLGVISHRYKTTAASSLNAAAFHDALAERLRDDEEVVGDRWSEDEVDELADQFWGGE